MNLIINDKCIGCGVCAEACPTSIISMKNSKPVLLAANCIRCGHCEAICPTNALENDLLNHGHPVEINENPVIDAKTAELFLRSRRSIRCFKGEIVSKEETERLLNIGRYAQTGCNSQGVSYMVVSSKKTIDELRVATMEYYKNQSDEVYKALYQGLSKAENDIIFRGAPMLILALTAKNNPYTADNAKYALTYIELFAPTLNLGTCWAGYFEHFAASDDQILHSILDLSDSYSIRGALLLGYKKYEYHRLTERNELSVLWR